jgi:DNA mismatch repair protein MutS
MSIVLEYFEISKKYQDMYGNKTILLYQVGSFFEIYSYIISKTNSISDITNIENVSEICNLNIGHKSSSIGENVDLHSDINCFPSNSKDIGSWLQTHPKSDIVMSGFRDYSIDKYINILTEANYTAIVYVQEKNGKNITRKLDRVYSPGTYISDFSSNTLSNNVISIWFDEIKSLNQIIIGCSNVNIFTGQSSISEYQTELSLNSTTFDGLEKFISEFNPSEIIVIYNFDEELIDKILQFIGVNKKVIVHRTNILHSVSTKIINSTKQTYINQILSTFFGDNAYNCCNFNSFPLATQSYCILLDFLQEHNPDLVRKIILPCLKNTSNKVLLANHTLRQLNIIDEDINSKLSGHLSSVLSFLNRCSTSMGKRQFKYQLLNPRFDEEWLNMEYSMIEHILQKFPTEINTIRKELLYIRDIQKINRQLISKKINPSTLFHLYKTIESIESIHKVFLSNDIIFEKYIDIKLETSNFLNFINKNFNIDNCQGINSCSSFENNIFNTNVSDELDDLLQIQKNLNNDISDIRYFLNNLISQSEKIKQTEHIKIHETEKSGITFQVTIKKSNILLNILNTMDSEFLIVKETMKIHKSDIKILRNGANNDISFMLLNGLCKNLLLNKEKINIVMSNLYAVMLNKIETGWYDNLESTANYISKLDVIFCKTFLSKEYNYCKPVINNKVSKSFVQCQGIRHVLIEHLNTSELYVDNNITLDSQEQGFLLYGINSAGKSTLIRAVGISIIMAQSGCFVPCTNFVYKPYTAIFTRIHGNDNLFKGLSYFAVEMSEIRNIVKMADENSLILGDEICSGTDSQSAKSIFMATLIDFYEKKSSFIFATHLHEISDFDEIKQMKKLSLKHLSVKYNRELDKLEHNRKLKDGTGTGTYGIEVALSLHLPSQFIDKAYEIRNKYFPETLGDLSLKTSSYNVKKLKTKCEICNGNADHIHHINEQQFADKNGFIGSIHKNHPGNLMSICVKCHNKQHHSH